MPHGPYANKDASAGRTKKIDKDLDDTPGPTTVFLSEKFKIRKKVGDVVRGLGSLAWSRRRKWRVDKLIVTNLERIALAYLRPAATNNR
jgi:hypothetical protein